jgi:hypothetical protein
MKNMKIKSQSAKRNRLIFPTILCVTSLLVNACTTQGTAYAVQTQPMSVDLEKQVLRETGLSGVVVGAVAGAVVGALLGGLAGSLAGGSTEEERNDNVRRGLITGAVAGGTLGGAAGYQKGQQKGQEIVAKGMGRDKLNQLLQGARAQNQHLASYNAGLREQIAKVKKIPDSKEKKLAYTGLRNQSNKELKEAEQRIQLREKALENPGWKELEKREYRAQKNDLVAKRNSLVASINQVSKLEQSVVF